MKALVAVGSNLSHGGILPKSIVENAIRAVEAAAGQVAVRSGFYRTPAFPPGSGPDFVNVAFTMDWAGTPEALLDLLHEVEAAFGRTRDARWEARVLDLDLIALGDAVRPDAATQDQWRALPLDQAAARAPDQLILPHPRLQDRGFVLVPLADVAPDWRHPRTGQSVAAMLAARPAAERAEITAIEGD